MYDCSPTVLPIEPLLSSSTIIDTISILFVEDDKGISKKMEILLYEIFSKIEIAFDGNEALEKYCNFYKANNEYPDLIITDIRMPNMDGIELIKHIYKENANQKIIVLSAHNESE